MKKLGNLDPTRRQLLVASAAVTPILLSPLGTGSVFAASQPKADRSQSFDLGWKFYRGEGPGHEDPSLDDKTWRMVDLPHDWSIEDLPPDTEHPSAKVVGPFDSKALGGTATGFTEGGEGWYRKHFKLNVLPGGRAELFFEGVYMNSDVWLNGHHLGVHPFGYTAFAYDLTPFLSVDGDNVIAVRVRNLGKNGRWYSGSGIYRHVWMDVFSEPARIERWGVAVSTRRIEKGHADLSIATHIDDLSPNLTLRSRIKDTSGKVVWEASQSAQTDSTQTASIFAPCPWSPETPALYTLETELCRGQTVVDRDITSFGIRIVTFDTTKGMQINGKPYKLRGGCIHHDNGLLGACSFDGAEDRKVRLLKARGYNALRPSHNPFSVAFLNACDRHGMLVLHETFDAWREPKLPDDYSVYFDQQWQSDLDALVKSARNHPSIILWSIGNEIPGRNSLAGMEVQWNLANEVHKLDPTRPVTAAINDFVGRPVVAAEGTARPGRAGVTDQMSSVFLDVAGYNYKLSQYEADHKAYPFRIMVGTESYPKDVFAIWDLTDRSPYLLGDFVWTAMDYLGEAGIGGAVRVKSGTPAMMAMMGGWPTVVSNCGDIDLVGNRKAASYARDVAWGLSPLEIAVQRPVPEGKVELLSPWGWSDELQSWTWPGVEGKKLAVRVYTSGDRVDLHLNGRLLETKHVGTTDLKHIEFQAVYAAGTLEAIAYRGEKEIARRQLSTVGASSAIRLTPESREIKSGRGEVSYISLELLDAHGKHVPDLAQQITISVSGPAELVGFGSGNPTAVGSFQSQIAQTWDGRALVILRGTGRSGKVSLTASSPGLKATTFVTLAS